MTPIRILEREQRFPLPIDQAFAFYGDARNLERITPPWLGFEVVTPGPIEMGRDLDRVPAAAAPGAGAVADADRGLGAAAALRRCAGEGPVLAVGAHAYVRGGRAGGGDHPRPG